MAGFRLVVAYDGTEFHGWQRQPGRRTVQGVIEEALKAVLDREVTVQGAGRTDAGVHARGQVASFQAETRLPPRAFPPLLSRHLPADVRIVAAAEAAPGFHARHSATARRYRYRLLDADDLLASRHAWRPPRPAGVEALERSARPLAGRHDFSAFLASGSPPATPVCRVFHAHWSRWEGGVAFDIVADHFLYHMVRTIVGTSLQVSAGEDPAGAMAAIVAGRDRRRAGPTAPPQGLALEHVFYPPEEVA